MKQSPFALEMCAQKNALQ